MLDKGAAKRRTCVRADATDVENGTNDLIDRSVDL
jgi:hypothetical protein